MSLGIVALVLCYISCCIVYVYRWRGCLRYPNFSMYLRKSWPIFAPLNCFLYLTTAKFAREPVINADYLLGIAAIRDNWPQIREEALALYLAGELDATAQPDSAGFYDVGFRTFYKRGWRKFYLNWYGVTHRSAQRLCPRTVSILQQVPGIKGAMFSVLPPNSELTLHSDPIACSLRYHLGLATPNSEQCFINVDGQKLVWQDGQDFVFDETYPHYVKNMSSDFRLILMCDVDRPMNMAGRFFNRLYSVITRATLVPNTIEDQRGFFCWLFSVVGPWQQKLRKLKSRNRRLYNLFKLLLNCTLLALMFLLLYGLIALLEQVGTTLF